MEMGFESSLDPGGFAVGCGSAQSRYPERSLRALPAVPGETEPSPNIPHRSRGTASFPAVRITGDSQRFPDFSRQHLQRFFPAKQPQRQQSRIPGAFRNHAPASHSSTAFPGIDSVLRDRVGYQTAGNSWGSMGMTGKVGMGQDPTEGSRMGSALGEHLQGWDFPLLLAWGSC